MKLTTVTISTLVYSAMSSSMLMLLALPWVCCKGRWFICPLYSFIITSVVYNISNGNAAFHQSSWTIFSPIEEANNFVISGLLSNTCFIGYTCVSPETASQSVHPRCYDCESSMCIGIIRNNWPPLGHMGMSLLSEYNRPCKITGATTKRWNSSGACQNQTGHYYHSSKLQLTFSIVISLNSDITSTMTHHYKHISRSMRKVK